MQGYNFTDGVRKALACARDEAAALGHGFVSPDHVVLGLLRARDGVVLSILERLRLNADDLQQNVRGLIPAGSDPSPGPDLPYSSRAKKVLERAMTEAREMRHLAVETRHLLLAALRDEESAAHAVLGGRGITPDAVRVEAALVTPSKAASAAVFRRSGGYDFSERVRRVLAGARDEAVRLHHEYVGTEHILLALVHDGGGVACAALTEMGAGLDQIAARVEEIVQHGRIARAPGPDLPFTSRAKKVLEEAMAEAGELRHGYIGTEHLLLGLLRESRGIAAQILNDSGIRLDELRATVLRLLGPAGEEDSQARELPPLDDAPRAGSRRTEPITSWGSVQEREAGDASHASSGANPAGSDTGPRRSAGGAVRQARLSLLRARAESVQEERMWSRLRHALLLCERLGTTPRVTLRADGAVEVRVNERITVVIPSPPGLTPSEETPPEGG